MALFTEKDEDLVKKFLFDKINNFCDADPGIMADYILVTLQNDMSESDLKEHCKSDLIEFFGDSTSSFVDSLFEDLKAKKYLSADAAADANAASTDVASSSKAETNDRSNGASSHRRRSSRSPVRDRHRHGDRERERERDRRTRSSRSPESRRSHREHRDSSHIDRSLLDGPLQPSKPASSHSAQEESSRQKQKQQQQQQQEQHALMQQQALLARQQQLMMLGQQQNQQHQQKDQQQQQPSRKTRACFEFMRTGQCQRGDACRYAHVTAENAQAMGMDVPQGIAIKGIN
ncbi:hypothetical protein LPJ73_006899, partial [Coemansia sp. RSA 2703]